jgi:hypothetical protein
VRPYLEKNPSQKRAGGVAQDVGPEFKPWYCQKKKKIQRERERETSVMINWEIQAIQCSSYSF